MQISYKRARQAVRMLEDGSYLVLSDCGNYEKVVYNQGGEVYGVNWHAPAGEPKAYINGYGRPRQVLYENELFRKSKPNSKER